MPHTSKAGPSAEALPGAISWAPNLQHSLSNTAPPATNPPKEPLTFRAVGEGEWTVLEYSQEKGVSEPIGAAEITDGIGVYARVTPEHVLIAHITSDIWKNQQCDSGLYEMWSQKKESAKEKKKNAKEMKKNAKEIKDIEENIKKNIAQVLNCLVRLGLEGLKWKSPDPDQPSWNSEWWNAKWELPYKEFELQFQRGRFSDKMQEEAMNLVEKGIREWAGRHGPVGNGRGGYSIEAPVGHKRFTAFVMQTPFKAHVPVTLASSSPGLVPEEYRNAEGEKWRAMKLLKGIKPKDMLVLSQMFMAPKGSELESGLSDSSVPNVHEPEGKQARFWHVKKQ